MELEKINLTESIWNALGFLKQKCNGGYARYYHKNYIPDFSYHNNGACISNGRLLFTIDDDGIAKNGPKTLDELYLVIEEFYRLVMIEQGRREAQYNFRKACGIDD